MIAYGSNFLYSEWTKSTQANGGMDVQEAVEKLSGRKIDEFRKTICLAAGGSGPN